MTAGDRDATVGDLGEFGLIDAITARLAQGPEVFIGPGDDAAVLRTPKGHVVVTTDVLVAGRHFRTDWSTATDIGHRSAAQNLSDINAMGGRSLALTVGLVLPVDLPAAWVLELVDGMVAEADKVGASVVGGDISAGDQVVIAITALGHCDVAPVRRGGALPGDVVALAGRQGWAAAGLTVLGRGFRSPRVLVGAHQRPEPPYDAGPRAAQAGAHAMIDVSDGLIADAGHIATASGVAIDLDSGAFVVDEPLQAVAAAIGAEPLGFILGGGDDHSLVATFAAGTPLPDGFQVIGTVAEGEGVTVDGEAWEGSPGHTHF